MVIEGSSLAEPLIAACYTEVLRAGGHPMVVMVPAGLQEAYYSESSDAQLEWISPVQRFSAEEADARIGINAPANTRELSGIDANRQAIRQRAMKPLMATMMERGSTRALKWVGTNYPTQMLAAEGDMSLRQYEDLFFSACLADKPDPVSAWNEAATETRRLSAWIEGRSEVRIVGPDTDITMQIGGRKFVAGDGKNNMPCGEFFTGPVESSAQGHISFHLPSVVGGREVSGVKLRFQDGKVVDASAERGEDYLIQMLDADPGARYLGELGIGTNFGIINGTRSILLDEKIGGTVHLAVGQSYPETGGENESAVHWDLICDLRQGGSITVDGELLQENGRFVV